jgi:hypothetical protein
VNVLIGFTWLKIGKSGGLLWTWQEPWGFMKGSGRFIFYAVLPCKYGAYCTALVRISIRSKRWSSLVAVVIDTLPWQKPRSPPSRSSPFSLIQHRIFIPVIRMTYIQRSLQRQDVRTWKSFLLTGVLIIL